MDYQRWIDHIEGLAGIYAFDIYPDGSYGEIKLMALNEKNTGVMAMNPNAPKFYPGIPWRTYFTDLNFESYIYKCAGTPDLLYSYANAHGFWLKGFYLPMIVDTETAEDGTKTVYCLYVGTMSPEVESDSMSQHSPEVSSAVMNISIKLHQSQDFHRSMAAAAAEIRKVCGSEQCAVYTVDKNSRHCRFIIASGESEEMMNGIASELERSPYDMALAWEEDLADSDCLMIGDLSVLKERDPVWHHSLEKHDIKNLILFGVRFGGALVGFILAANYDTDKMIQIKETLETASCLIGAVIANHQLVSRLELKSTMDGLTEVSNWSALNERTGRLSSGETPLPQAMGIVYADLNGLKTVNDLYGHDAGDKLLHRAASLMKIAFGDHEIYRAGGDEFVVLCPGITEEALEQQTAQLRALTESTPDVRFAIGTVMCSGEYDISGAMQEADERMYRDKQEYYRLHPDKNRRRQNE